MKRRLVPAAVVAAVLAAPAAAQAHVTLQPAEVAAGEYTRLDVRVPNERDDAGTTEVAIQMPDGFASVSYEPVPGWTGRVTREPAPQPIELHGERVGEQVDTVTFSGGVIEPGQFQDFGLSLRIPEGEPGDTLTFKALQTYEGGEVVRWIGPPDSDEPAPTVTLTAGGNAHGAAGAEDVSATPAGATDDGGGDGLAIAALIVGALGLVAGLAGLMTGRRARAQRTGGREVATQS